jgi:hypothetical protein
MHTITWWQVLHEHGRVVPMARIHRAIGMGSDNLLGKVLGADYDTRDDPQISAAHGRLLLSGTTWSSQLPERADCCDDAPALGAPWSWPVRPTTGTSGLAASSMPIKPLTWRPARKRRNRTSPVRTSSPLPWT